MSWFLNTMFNGTASFYRGFWHRRVMKYLSVRGSQETLIRELNRNEEERKRRFLMQYTEKHTEDILDRALVKVKINLLETDAPQYYRIKERIDALRKLRFTEELDKSYDKDMYEWMKYKVAAEIGDTEEREAFKMFERQKINEKGHTGFRLWRERIEKDPLHRLIGNM